MSLCQMVDEHPAPLETQEALVTLVDEAVVVGRRYLKLAIKGIRQKKGENCARWSYLGCVLDTL
jgi:hypothetical protein